MTLKARHGRKLLAARTAHMQTMYVEGRDLKYTPDIASKRLFTDTSWKVLVYWMESKNLLQRDPPHLVKKRSAGWSGPKQPGASKQVQQS